jgi:hypothetical protein
MARPADLPLNVKKILFFNKGSIRSKFSEKIAKTVISVLEMSITGITEIIDFLIKFSIYFLILLAGRAVRQDRYMRILGLLLRDSIIASSLPETVMFMFCSGMYSIALGPIFSDAASILALNSSSVFP